MKTIEKIIKYEDYNYVEGILQFKAYGKKINETKSGEFFSITSISSTRLEVDKKYLPPDLPKGINLNKVSTLYFLDKIPTVVDGNYLNPYLVQYDEIIVDDDYVDSHGNIKGHRFFTNKSTDEISSTVEIKIYGLIKIPKERIEKCNQYEINKIIEGDGEIILTPQKQFYDVGDLVHVTAKPKESEGFLGWGDYHSAEPPSFSLKIKDEDIYLKADFTEVIVCVDPTEKAKKWEHIKIEIKPLGLEATGCWPIIGLFFQVLFFLAILFVLIAIFGKWLVLIGGIVFLLWLLTLLPSSLFSWRFLRYILSLGFAILLISGFINVFNNIGNYRNTASTDEIPLTIETINENESKDFLHHLKWQDYKNKTYETDLVINSDVVSYSSRNKNRQPNMTTVQDYDLLLSNLHNKSGDAYLRILPKMDSIKMLNSLSRKRYAEVIVSMVQSIPYVATVEQSCNPFDYQDPRIRQLLQSSPCEPNQKFGIKTPAEFLSNLKGDCDTRTLFLFGLLKKSGYDVAIYGSDYYGHSILGINLDIEATHYKVYNNKKYYLWEVTGKSFLPGELPEPINNLKYWTINLK
tara:strand:- start:924 stop:2651 length:1728 start_codon:yes stop_codon:yes gene_type:complete